LVGLGRPGCGTCSVQEVKSGVTDSGVGKVFITDQGFDAEGRSGCAATRRPPVFESRDPAKQAWLEWNRERSYRRILLPDEEIGCNEATVIRRKAVGFPSGRTFENWRQS